MIIVVRGTPAPQGSKRAFVGRSGKAHVIESSHDRVKSWRQAVVDQALAQQIETLRGPVTLGMTFLIRRPKGHYGTGRNAGVLKPGAPAYPTGTPDLSKLARSTEDALTDAGAWDDDAQIVGYKHLRKRYTTAAPGCIISIEETTDSADARAFASADEREDACTS